ncbi:septal ring lytic transglycosylase RlpA family protein [Dyella sp. S184]|uniref:septal ring lytic transglycosylase RlpA family protein n=1 Tax=Dyella sp. S184 TaxID=1641862 RepID=UPI00131DDD19|nr:septal ring lytic transglycosylase RlpA family protein [Dyella sp. S184]
MKKSGCAAATLLAVLLLAGCSGTKTRPAATNGVSRSYGHAPTGSTGSSDAGSTPFNDDISRSQDSRYRDSSDSVPGGPPPDISKLVEPVPKLEPRSLYGNKSPYSVLGQTYRVLPGARDYDERGIASFYGNKFHGYKTSSLETYDMYAFSAASKTLPLPSYARVTNLQNGKSVIVRVNDRGPFHEDRVIDLSYAAAVKIGIWPKGTGLVEVRGIDPGEPASELPPPVVVTSGHPGIYLQVGAFSDADNAERVAQRLRQAGLGTVQVTDAEINGQHVRRVRVGPLADVNSADQVSARIEGMGLPRPQVAVD